MIKFLIISIVFLVMHGCTNEFPAKTKKINNHSEPKSVVNTSIIKDTTLIKSWVTKIIIDFVNSDDLKAAYNKMHSKLTNNYYNYKQDAMNLEYSDEMTEEEFHKKWKAKYNTKYVGKGGFFISAQDNGTIGIPICKHLRSLGDSAQNIPCCYS